MHAKEKYKKLQNFLTLWKESTEEIKKKKTLYCNIADEKKKKKKFLFAKEKKRVNTSMSHCREITNTKSSLIKKKDWSCCDLLIYSSRITTVVF